ncbi:MAG: bifunctional diaminohydroxyphosphoribosylaminopyrimidine deaminase/5-amino-6-(5-phosphoribosylamino)uracil reductase RibD [Myxococcota bacterium]|nr:bifunctional diaminohydroxyphosphoribosylaminopyrimidine deaminase/5-amino-6-(5-phosphoribosylamino)uracil reductase RibD [Myxococcota bacterium]
MSETRNDEAQMKRALSWAARSAGRVHPNPAVGAVVFRAGRVLGCGRTQPPGGNHAEVQALAQAERRHGARALRGASLAVTLEPCCFEGRTGPCTEAIVRAGLRRVVVGCRDPHPRVSGRGLRAMRSAGLEVSVGVLESLCRTHHRGFFSVCDRGRPFVTLKLATSLDGRIATAQGESRWITSPEARAWVHRTRARVDAVMVGSGTALADDPKLSARRGARVTARPVRVLVDSRLRVPLSAHLYDLQEGARSIVLCRQGAPGCRRLREAGVEVLDVPGRSGELDLQRGLERLAEADLTTLLVEGGGGLAAALLRADLIDEIHWFLAPRLLGAEGVSALGPLGIGRLAEAPKMSWESIRRTGPDLHLVGRLEQPAQNKPGKARGRK